MPQADSRQLKNRKAKPLSSSHPRVSFCVSFDVMPTHLEVEVLKFEKVTKTDNINLLSIKRDSPLEKWSSLLLFSVTFPGQEIKRQFLFCFTLYNTSYSLQSMDGRRERRSCRRRRSKLRSDQRTRQHHLISKSKEEETKKPSTHISSLPPLILSSLVFLSRSRL